MKDTKNKRDDPLYYKEGHLIRVVRPLALVVLLAYLLLAASLDGNWGAFAVRDIYLHIIEGVLIAMVAFLYSSRGAEKVSQILAKRKQPQEPDTFTNTQVRINDDIINSTDNKENTK